MDHDEYRASPGAMLRACGDALAEFANLTAFDWNNLRQTLAKFLEAYGPALLALIITLLQPPKQ